MFNWLRRAIKVKPPRKPSRVRRVDLIKKHEGLRLKAYKPTVNDVWTIGYGHTHTAKRGMVITEAQAEVLLREDLAWVRDVLRTTVDVPVTQNQYDALASLIYNIGAGAFHKSTVRKRLNASDYAGAADAFLMWNKQRNRRTGRLEPLRGLTRRRQEERQLFLGETS